MKTQDVDKWVSDTRAEMKALDVWVDNIGGSQPALPKKASNGRKKGHRTLKMIGAIVIVCMLVPLGAYATYITFFAQFDKQLTVTQSITVDGHNWDKPFTYAGQISAGCCEIDGPHTITNNGCEGIWLDFITTETSDPVQSLDGLTISIKECGTGGEPTPCYLTELDLKVLDGVAEWDDFTVEVNGVLVFTYDAVGGGENWIDHVIDLTSFDILCIENNVVKITCTNGPWQYFNPYGQLAVDYVALWCDNGCPACPPVMCDSVNIGDVASEANHIMVGWGPIEPATHGGTYGGITDCRTTWFYEDPQIDEAWATIELTCDCEKPTQVVDHECTCSTPDMKLPFYLAPGETLDFCIAYKADMLLQPNVYNIRTLLVPGIAPQA